MCHDGSCHHDMERPQMADGREDFQMWRVAANILNKQSRTDKGWSSSFWFGQEITTPHPRENTLLNVTRGFGSR